MLEDSSIVLRDLTLENPIRAIREISHDITCQRRVRLANGRECWALDIQVEYLERALQLRERRGLSPEEDRALDMWQHCLKGLEADPMSLDRECDWVTKYRLVEQMRRRHDVSLSHPKVAMIDLMYHDVDRSRGLFYQLQSATRWSGPCTDEAITEAMTEAPRDDPGPAAGRVREAAKERRRDFTVDWVAPEAERPGAAHRAAEGSLQVARRASGAPDPVALSGAGGARPARHLGRGAAP